MNSATRYQAILFDVGGTLVNVVRDPHVTAVEAIAHLGVVQVSAFSVAIRTVVEEWRTANRRPEAEDLPETWIQHNRRALALLGFAGDIHAAAQIMEDVFLSEGLELYPDVAEVLDTLAARGYKVGIVSNWPATLESTLERLGLRQYFPVIVGSGAVGYSKPHARIFQIALDRMGIGPERTLYIGDSIQYDVEGAKAADLDVVLLDRLGRHLEHQPRIESLAELPDAR
jgi:HAD superfamily hydrolase (TIGR01549 family)